MKPSHNNNNEHPSRAVFSVISSLGYSGSVNDSECSDILFIITTDLMESVLTTYYYYCSLITCLKPFDPVKIQNLTANIQGERERNLMHSPALGQKGEGPHRAHLSIKYI